MSASERAQALHYRQQVEALFDDYAPDFEAIHHVDNASGWAIQPSGLRKPKSEAMAALGAAAIARPPWPGGGRLGRH